MAYKIFLDANVILDYSLNREHYEEAKALFELIQNNYANAFITSSVLHIIGYWIGKSHGVEKTKALLLRLLTEIKVIDITHEVAEMALNSKINDIEDALQYYTAIHHKLDYFISRDKQLKKSSLPSLQVYTPEEFTSRLL